MNMNEHRNTFLLTIATAFLAHGVVSFVSNQAVATPGLVDVPYIAPPVEERIAKPATSTPAKASFPKLGKGKSIDLAFCIDTTGSMSAEIETVKAQVKSIVAKLNHGQSTKRVRVALVAYRDKGDDYVTKVIPFSSDVDKFTKDISDLNADGGGDGPEAVDKGVHAALNELSWDREKNTAKVLYVIGDAPPHFEPSDYSLYTEARDASTKGISISTISCGDLNSYGNQGEEAFKQLALMTNGHFQPLSYQQEIVDASGKHTSLITAGGKTYALKEGSKADWKDGAEALVASGAAVECGSAPMLQGATCGTIGPQGCDATVICGVNTAGTVRTNNNLGEMMFQDALNALSAK